MQVPVRRGLPRTPGGEPWPPVATVEVAGLREPELPASTIVPTEQAALTDVPVRRGLPRIPGGEPWPPVEAVRVALPLRELAEDEAPADVASAADAASATGANGVAVPLRRGLPRTPGGEPWPPAESVTVAPETAELRGHAETPAPEPTLHVAPSPEPQTAPVPATVPVAAGAAAKGSANKQAPNRTRWVWPAAAVAVLAVGVLLSRWFLGTGAGADFVQRYDGAQPLPADAPTGFPAWLGWAHFFNMFLMALIMKTGWQLHRETKAPAYWAPKSNPRAKISLTQWTHLVLDAAWIALGVVFYVLLFTTGQWVRIVPTSWETVPNAVSAGLQYLSLDWPAEDPWLHYNSLQELSYFAVVFVAAPLAILSGWRMSPLWPKGWKKVPMKAARRIHFPVMVFFVLFLVVHVALVLLTGVRGNLNAMFAMRQDPNGWTGVVMFLGAALATVAGWFAVRPLIVAPVAGKFGSVSQR